MAASSRLVHMARLGGDFVAAQCLERELGSFIEETRRLLEAEGTGYEAYDETVGIPDSQDSARTG